MRYFRRLPALLRVMSILGLLFTLMALGLFLAAVITDPAAVTRAEDLGRNLVSLGLACSFVVNAYAVRFRRAGWASYPLDSWQSQVRWWVLLGALPLGVLLVALLLPGTPLFTFVLGLPTLLGLLVQGVACIYALAKWPVLT